MELLPWILLGAMIIVACVSDVRARRIPNALTLGGLLAGLCLQAFYPVGNGLFDLHRAGGLGFVAGLQGVGLMLAATFILWRLRLFGAGDAKLLIAASAFFGPLGVMPLIITTLLAGGIQAVLSTVVAFYNGGGKLAMLPASVRLPYSLAIAIASAVTASVNSAGMLR